MYLVETIQDKKRMSGGFLPTFKQEEIDKADRLEVWGSSFNEDGGDYNIFKLMQGDTVVARKIISGY